MAQAEKTEKTSTKEADRPGPADGKPPRMFRLLSGSYAYSTGPRADELKMFHRGDLVPGHVPERDPDTGKPTGRWIEVDLEERYPEKFEAIDGKGSDGFLRRSALSREEVSTALGVDDLKAIAGAVLMGSEKVPDSKAELVAAIVKAEKRRGP